MQPTIYRFKLLPIAFGIAAMSFTSAGAFAADAAANPAAASTSTGIEEVIVTARKVEESQQSIPITVAAFSAKDIENKVVLGMRDLGKVVSGMTVTLNSQGGSPTFAVRGTRTDNGVDGGVAVYLDDVPMISALGLVHSFYDISSVEVLKGPQGTQFGVNTTGGTITVRANKPTDKFEGFAEMGVANFNGSEFTGMINVPVNDVLQLRLAGNWAKRDGWVKNVAPNRGPMADKFADDDHNSFRFSARIKSGSLTNDIVADYFNEDRQPNVIVPLFLSTGPGTLSSLGATLGTRDTVNIGVNPAGAAYTRTVWTKNTTWGIQDVLNWEANDNVSIKNVLGYRDDKLSESGNDTGTTVTGINVLSDTRNKELVDDFTLRLSSDDKRLRSNFGVFLSRTDRTDGVIATVVQNLFLSLGAGPLGVGLQNQAKKVTNSRSLYANADYDLSRELTVSLGLRYNWDSANFSYTAGQGIGLPDMSTTHFGPDATHPCTTALFSGFSSFNAAQCRGYEKGKWKAPSFNFVITDKFAERSLIYAKISGGYLAGGFNAGLRGAGLFNPEKTTAFEAGIKSDWELWSRPIRTNFDVFYGNSKDRQEFVNTNYDDGSSAKGVLNAGSLTFYGTDLEVKYVPVEGLELNLDWTHLESNFDNFRFPALGGPNPAGTTYTPAVDLTGNTPNKTPKDTLSMGLSYTWPLASSVGRVTTSFTSAYTSEFKYHDRVVDGPLFNGWDTGKAYWISNFSTTWKGIMGSNFDANFWVTNLFDKKHTVHQDPEVRTFTEVLGSYGEPRMFGLKVRYNF